MWEYAMRNKIYSEKHRKVYRLVNQVLKTLSFQN